MQNNDDKNDQPKKTDQEAAANVIRGNIDRIYSGDDAPHAQAEQESKRNGQREAAARQGVERDVAQRPRVFSQFHQRRLGDEAAAILKQKARTEREIANIKRSIMDGADSVMFSRELQERKRTLDELQPKLALIEGAGAVPKLEYDPARLGVWMANLRGMIVKADFDQRRELVRRFVKKVVVRPDKTALMTWDLPAVVSFFDGKEVPGETLDLRVLTSNGCGGWI